MNRRSLFALLGATALARVLPKPLAAAAAPVGPLGDHTEYFQAPPVNSYLWLRNGLPIPGAGYLPTYTLTPEDMGADITPVPLEEYLRAISQKEGQNG